MSKHFRVEYDSEKIAWLHFDSAEESANVLSAEVLEEFDQQLVSIAQAHPTGLIILSDKSSGFIAGADVKAFAGLSSAAVAQAHIERAHEIFHRLESLAFPTVALIHGYCLGGGLELALACRYRVARNDAATRLGFPEVRLGIFPGFGGSVRSVRTIGHLRALELMLSGRGMSSKAARRIGLIDYAVPERQLRDAALQLLAERPQPARAPWWQRLAGWGPIRPGVAALMARQVRKKAPPEHYPAPYSLLEHWQRHVSNPADMYRSEATRVAELVTSDTAQNLVRVFLLQERLKTEGDKDAFAPQHVHVVGGGVMGGDIAAWCALRGFRVTLQDRAPEYLTRAMQRAHQLFKRKLKDKYLVMAAMDRLIPDHRGDGVPTADVVIEAIFEDIDAKRKLYKALEPRIKPDALLATNTSSIPLQTLGEQLQRPGRIVGLHFFNPVAQMQLIEIVSHGDSEPEMVRRAASFARHIDKLPLPVQSKPGFLVNRVLMPYLLEAIELFEEGVPAPIIDQAAIDFGMPMGPIVLADTIGLDVCLAVAEKMAVALGNPVPERLRTLVQTGRSGRKSGKGFYTWRKGRAEKPKVAKDYQPPTDLTDRLILRLVNESVACLREKVVEDADLLDAGIIFGTGFAPFRGGPMHYARDRGTQQVTQCLDRLENNHGPHFHADDGWAAVS